MKADRLENGSIRGCANIASSEERKKGSLPLRLSTYYLIMVQCLRAHVSMIEITQAQLTAYRQCMVSTLLDALCVHVDGGCRRCRGFLLLLLKRRRCWTYLSRGSYLLLGLRPSVFRRCRYCLIRCFCHVEMRFCCVFKLLE